MQKELFRDDSYLKTCSAKIIEIVEEGLVLDNNIFYPEGGGQPGDIGNVKADKNIFKIINTKYVDKKIVHCLETSSVFNLNQEILCEINWKRRFKIMQVHSCLHLLCSLIKYPVTGGQISEGKGRLDFDIESKPDKDFVMDSINKLIKENHNIRVSSITEEELDKNPDLIRTMAVQPPRGSGSIRMISIGEDIDYQPCGGTHVKNTSEIGLVTKVKVENKGRMNKRVILELNN
tara:strand:+ start:32 stop:730 length:699 start_codon:yes stop_codon:yes gene_type:complete